VATLLRRAQVIAPRTLHGLDAAYDEIERPDQVAWGYRTTISPQKGEGRPEAPPEGLIW